MVIEDAIAGLIQKTGLTSGLFLDIFKEDGVNSNSFASIFTDDLLTIDADSFTSTTAATQPNITTTTWQKGRRLQLHIDTLDSAQLARDPKIILITHATDK